MTEPGPMSKDAGNLLGAMPLPTETPQPPWLLSFCDFVSCLLACFVLLYSLVALDQAKLNQILEGVPGRQVVEDIPANAEKRAMAPAPEQDARNADYLTSVLRAKVEQDPALTGVTVEGQGDRVLLHLPVKQLLSVDTPNGAAGEGLVHALGGALTTLPNRMAIEVRPDRPAEFSAGLTYAVRLAQRLEQAGADGEIGARARVTAAGERTGIVLIVFDTAPAPARAH